MTTLGNSLASRDVASLLHPYTNLRMHQKKGPMIIVGGRGVHVYDDQGKEYIEGLAGLWCVSLGFSEPRLVEAAPRQMAKLAILPRLRAQIARALRSIWPRRLLKLLPVPMSKVFFNNSGSEANDTAIKIIWYYNNALRPAEEEEDHRARLRAITASPSPRPA